MIRDMEVTKQSIPAGIKPPSDWNGVTKHFALDGDQISAKVASQKYSASVLIQNHSPYLLVCDSLDESTFWQGYGGSLTYSRCIRPYSEVVNFGAYSNAATGTENRGTVVPFASCFRLSIWNPVNPAAKTALYMDKEPGALNDKEQKSLAASPEKDQTRLRKWFDTQIGLRKVDNPSALPRWAWRVPKVKPNEAPPARQRGAVFIWVEGPTKLKANDSKAEPTYQALTYICDNDEAAKISDLLAKSLKRRPADIPDIREIFSQYSFTQGNLPTQAYLSDRKQSWLNGTQSVGVSDPVSKENPAPNLTVTLFPPPPPVEE
jgi:hypothetical protein